MPQWPQPRICESAGSASERFDQSDPLAALDNIFPCRDFRFLLEMPNIEMLILDHNGLTAHVKLPHLSKLHTLWANHNDISNLGGRTRAPCVGQVGSSTSGGAG